MQTLTSFRRFELSLHTGDLNVSQYLYCLALNRLIFVSDENEDVAIKVSDQGGGIPRSAMPRIWSYLYTTAAIDV